MAKVTYVEPNGYFTKEMKKILEEGEKNKKTTQKKSSKAKTVKKSK